MAKPAGGDEKRILMRHALATLAYRVSKAVRGAPESFAGYRADQTSRTPAEIVAHMGDLMDWSLSIAQGAEKWRNSTPLPWPQEIQRFFAALGRLDAFLASGKALSAPLEKLFQGPVADALTHTGQLAMLRRMAGSAMKGESYYHAEMAIGRVGLEQAKPVKEF